MDNLEIIAVARVGKFDTISNGSWLVMIKCRNFNGLILTGDVQPIKFC